MPAHFPPKAYATTSVLNCTAAFATCGEATANQVWARCTIPVTVKLKLSLSSGRVNGEGGGGARNIKSMRPPSVAIFFMTYFDRAVGGGAWPPRPPDPLLYS